MLSGQQLAAINIIYEFSESDQIPVYTAVTQVMLSPLSGLMPVIGGIFVNILGYIPTFLVAGLFGAGGAVGMLFNVRNPFEKHKKQLQPPKTMKSREMTHFQNVDKKP
jgi:hypothetical protein